MAYLKEISPFGRNDRILFTCKIAESGYRIFSRRGLHLFLLCAFLLTSLIPCHGQGRPGRVEGARDGFGADPVFAESGETPGNSDKRLVPVFSPPSGDMIILDSSNTLPVRVSAPQDPMETLLQKDPLPGEGGEPPLKNFPEEDFVGSASHVLPPGDAPGLEDPAVDLVPPSRIFLPSLDSDLLPEDRREKSAYEQRLYASFAEELSTDLIRKREILARLDDPAKVMIGGEQPDLARFRGARQTASRLNRTLSILHLLLFAGSLGPPETQALPFAWEQIPPLTHPWFQIADLRVAIWSMERKLLRIRSGLAEPNELRERRKMKEPVETAEMVEPVMPETGTAPAPAPAPAPAVPRADSP